MTTFALFLTLAVAYLVRRLYERATSGMTATQLTILDIILAVSIALFLWWGFPHVSIERSSVTPAVAGEALG